MKIGDKMLAVDGSYAMTLVDGVARDIYGIAITGRTWKVVGKGTFPTGLGIMGKEVEFKNNVVLTDGDTTLFIRETFLKPAVDKIREEDLKKEYLKGFAAGKKYMQTLGQPMEIERSYQGGRDDMKADIIKELEKDFLQYCECPDCLGIKKTVGKVMSIG